MAECSPDWPRVLRRASFRGVPFFVESDDIKYGRRIKVHEFPNRDRPFVEDLGEKAIGFSVTAYLASDNVLAEKDRLVAACRQRGAGSLILPDDGPMQVKCYECDRKHSKDKLGYIAFSLSFHEAGADFGTMTLGFLSNLVGVAVGALGNVLGPAFFAAFNTVGELGHVRSAAAAVIASWGARVDEARLSIRLKGPEAADLSRDITSLVRSADTLAYGGRGILLQNQTALGMMRPMVTNDLPDLVADLMASVRLAAVSNDEAIEALSILAQHDVSTFADGEALSLTAKAEQANERAISSLFRRFAMAELAVAATDGDFESRQRAIQVRALVAEFFEREMASADGPDYRALAEIQGRASVVLSRLVADLRPTIVVESNSAEPSLVWAYRLYADAKRGDDLADRNRVRHPAFMPATLEAEAP